jgi:hypothetical protein
MTAEDDLLKRLIGLHDGQLQELRRLDAHYEGTQPLSYMHPELVQQLEGQVRQVVINWPQLVVDAVEERLNIEGFRRPGAPSGDAALLEMWQTNDMDAGSQRAHVEALALSHSYATVGAGDTKDDSPVICDETALDMIAVTDPRTRKTKAALRRWSDEGDDQGAAAANRATLYLPMATIGYRKDGPGWVEDSRDWHDLDAVPVVPILNRPRRKRPFGVSELAAVLPLSDAACKIATDMMVGSNFHALPRYFATGVQESDFTDEQGNPVSVWKTVTGRIWSTEDKEAKLGAFPASDLANFHKTLDALAQLVSSQYGLPPHYLGFSTDNPASAEAIKSSEARLNLRAERRQGMFDVGWEEVIRIADRIRTGAWDPALRRLETAWRDPSTPTIAQAADAAVKTFQAGIVPLRFTRRRLGFNDAEIDQMEKEDAEAQAQQSAMFKVPTAAEQAKAGQIGQPGGGVPAAA